MLLLLLLLLNTCHERTRERPAPLGTHASFHVRLRLSKSPSSDFIWRGTTARDFVARGRPLRGQKRLAPLAKRSTCSKSTCCSVAWILATPLLAGYVRLRSHSRRSLLGEWGAKVFFPVHVSLHRPSIQSERTVHPVLRRIPSHHEANALFLESSYFTDDVHTAPGYHVHDHSNPSDQTTVYYLVSVLARIRFKHLWKCNCKLLDL